VTSKSSAGPWHDPLGKPLLSDKLAKTLRPATTFRDPCIFEDPDDGSVYILSGVFNYFVAKLGPDMISLAETPRYLPVLGTPVSGSTGSSGFNMTDDMPFMHKNNGIYYLSWGNFYAMSKTGVYGPYVFQGSVIDTAKLAPAFRMNNSLPVGAPGWYHGEDYTDRHGSFLHHKGQWFFSTNDRSHSSDLVHAKYKGGGTQGDGDSRGFFRDTVMCYIHYRSNGTMEPCIVDAVGVGTYDGRRLIEAENFFSIEGAQKVDLRTVGGGDGFAVGGIRGSGATLVYPRVTGLLGSAGKETVLRMRIAGGGGGLTLVVKQMSSSQGSGGGGGGGGDRRVVQEVGRCQLNHGSSAGLADYRTVSCRVHLVQAAFKVGELSLVLAFEGNADNSGDVELARIDHFTLGAPPL
jgi:hypothetical protein